MNKWQAIHGYRKLVKDNSAPGLMCPECQVLYISRFGLDEDPVLWCYMCRSTVTPGTSLWKQIYTALGETYDPMVS